MSTESILVAIVGVCVLVIFMLIFQDRLPFGNPDRKSGADSE